MVRTQPAAHNPWVNIRYLLQLVGLSAHLATAVVVLSNGAVESEPIELATTISEDELHRTSAHLSRLMVGKALGDIAHSAATGDVVAANVTGDAVAPAAK